MTAIKLSTSLNELILSALDSITSPPEQALNELSESPSSKHTILGDMPIAARWLHNLCVELANQAKHAHEEFCNTEDYSAEESAARLKRDQLANRFHIATDLKWALLRDTFPQHKHFVILRDWKVAKASEEYVEEHLQQLFARLQPRR
jgi:hypothetical protein